MHSHDSANVTRKVSSAGSDGEILDWVQSIAVDHEISVVFVYCWCLASIPRIEEFWQRLLLDVVYRVHIKPSAIAGQDNGVCLRYQM